MLKISYIFCLYSLSVLIHEYAHFFVAKKLGYKCQNITLSAFGAVLYGDFDQLNDDDGIKIALAGPLTNLALGLLIVAFWWLLPESYAFSYDFAMCNFSLCLINLLPCYPLDGGRVLMCCLKNKEFSLKLKICKVLSVCLSVFMFLIFAIGLFLGVKNFSLGLFAIFVLLVSCGEVKSQIYSRQMVFDGYKKGVKTGMEKKTLVFDGDVTLRSVVKKLKGNYYFEILVLKDSDYFFCLQHKQINTCLTLCSLDTKLKNLIQYKL